MSVYPGYDEEIDDYVDDTYVDARYAVEPIENERYADYFSDDYMEEINNSSPSPAQRYPSRPVPGLYTPHQYSMPNNAGYFDDDEYLQDTYMDNVQYDHIPQQDPQHRRQQSQPQYYQQHSYPQRQNPAPYYQPAQPRRPLQLESRPWPGQTQETAAPQSPSPQSQDGTVLTSTNVQLRPVSDLPDMYRGLYKFGVFNAVQSTCFDSVLDTNENLVISAPTGSGKTVLFELAVIRMVSQSKATGKTFKCVYVAPTKALCSERQRDWSNKFTPLGIKCCELTGDTVHFGKGAWGDAKSASIIITTGEKWDSLTRNWDSHSQILSQIQLFLVDEVHILNENRGSTLEVVISRMKLRGSSVRFVMVSATVPNIQDIANWVSSANQSDKAAKVYEFGNDFRPCKLKRVVVSIPKSKNANDFQYTKTLDFKLFDILQTHSVGKPIMIFCSTRKGVVSTAEQLLKDFTNAQDKKQKLPWATKRIDSVFVDKKLTLLAVKGIGIHHAGLTMEDRRTTEELYLQGSLRIICCTSTLAIGINLPAHTVVIKGVKMFQNGAMVEYSDLDIIQMMGRAGRPQFDKDGIAIIMCEPELEAKYNALASGSTVLESSLHRNLSEHLNSEIGLGTITNIDSAKVWLKNSFLFQRIKKNPDYYSLGKEDAQTWEERVDDIVIQNLEVLKKTELIDYEGQGNSIVRLSSTEYGDIMSKFYIRQSTMSAILAIPEQPTLRDILEMMTSAGEVCEGNLRAGEKSGLNKLRRHNDIRFEVKKVEKTADKVNLLIQAILGGISLNDAEFKSNDSQLQLEAYNVLKHAPRIARAVVEVAITRSRGAQLKHALELVRCLTAKAWEDRPIVLRQVESIGEKSIKVLAEHDIMSISRLRQQDPHRIEMLLNRRPPFGLDVLSALGEFPIYFVNIKQQKISTYDGQRAVEVDLIIECGTKEQSQTTRTKKSKYRGSNMTAILTLTSDLELVDFRRISTKMLQGQTKSFEVTAKLEKPSQIVHVYITSEHMAGLTVCEAYKPSVSPNQFPVMNTKPMTLAEAELAAIANDPRFMEDIIPSDDETTTQLVPVKDLTIPQDREKPSSASTMNGSQVKSAPIVKLNNGHYACQHSCKDKKGCRHLCCKDGTVKKPHTNNKQEPSQPETSQTIVIQAQPQKPKKRTPQRVDRTLEHLEGLHKSTNVQGSLNIANGKRLKLESGPTAPRKRAVMPNFDITFSEIKVDENDIPTAIPDLDDEELPETRDILVKTLSSDNYGTSELDELIGSISEQELQNAYTNTKKRISHQPQDGPKKRYKFDDDVVLIRTPPLESQKALFLPSPRTKQTHFEDVDGFKLDHQYFGTASMTSPDTPDLTMSTDIGEDDKSFEEPFFDNVLQSTEGQASNSKVEEFDAEADFDEFDELEAWLNSGAINTM